MNHRFPTRRQTLNWFKARLSDKDIRDGRRCECLPLPTTKLTFVSELAANIDAVLLGKSHFLQSPSRNVYVLSIR